MAVRLYGIWSGDEDLRVKGCVGTLIKALLPDLATLGYAEFLQGNRKVAVGDLQTAAASATSNPDGFLDRLVAERSRRLQKWAAICKGLDSGVGALASAVHPG